MSTKAQDRQSLFFRDLASPISSSHRASGFASSGHSAAASPISALWRENFATSDTPPPPPVFTLEDRIDFSPEPALPTSPGSVSEIPRTPTPSRNYVSTTPSPIRTNGTAERTPGNGSWWAPQRGEVEEVEEKGKGSPVDGVVTSSRALVMLPPLKEVAKVEMRNQLVAAREGMMMDEEEWVTVYGFSSGDTNLVLREFEKCGVILKHVPGPRDANWMHILYQNRYDAQKALGKNGMQLNSALIVGVKPVDSVQRQYLNAKLNNTPGGFMTSLPPQSTPGRLSAISPRSNYQKNSTVVVKNSGPRSTGAIAFPEKSVLSKVMDLMFGF